MFGADDVHVIGSLKPAPIAVAVSVFVDVGASETPYAETSMLVLPAVTFDVSVFDPPHALKQTIAAADTAK